MTSLDQEIADLKEEIKEYDTKLNTATTEKELALFAGLIITRSETLNRLLDEKKAHSGGKFFGFIVYVCMTLDQRIADLEEEIKGYVS
jgi:hypothetical protein